MSVVLLEDKLSLFLHCRTSSLNSLVLLFLHALCLIGLSILFKKLGVIKNCMTIVLVLRMERRVCEYKIQSHRIIALTT